MSLQARTKALAQSLERNRALRARMDTIVGDRSPRIHEPVPTGVNRAAASAIDPSAEIAAPTPEPVAKPLRSTAIDDAAGNRRSRRRQTSLPATMAFANMRVTVPCIVVDMSGTGARLELPPASVKQFGDAEHLPSRLMLILKADRMQIDCEVKWRRAGKIGVRFLGAPQPMDAGKK